MRITWAIMKKFSMCNVNITGKSFLTLYIL